MASTRTDHATTGRSTGRVLPLDGIRAIAILAVVLYHVHIPHFQGGFVGVNVFFVLSGYLITSLLLKEHRQTATIKLGRFWARRILRLYPTLLAVVAVGAGLWFVVGDVGTTKNLSAGGAALIALTYTGNFFRAYGHVSQGVFAPSWSLAMEEQFYAVWPPLLLLLLAIGFRRKIVAWMLGCLIVVSAVLAAVFFSPSTGAGTPDIYFSPVSSVAPLLMGCVVALALTHEKAAKLFAGRAGTVSSWVGFAGIFAIMFSIGSDWKQEAHFFGLVLPAVGLATALMIAGISSRVTLLSRVLSLGPLAWFGRNVSYSLYLWHMLVVTLLEPFVSGLAGNLLLVAASTAVAIGSHFAIERPFLTIKKRFEPAEWSKPVARAGDGDDSPATGSDGSRPLATAGAAR
jgi:peptidoglycan/LPS O-acetylase OafA/YrhL